MQQRGFAKTRSATAALPLQSRFSECQSGWQASCPLDLLFNISSLQMCCSWRTIFSAVHKKILAKPGGGPDNETCIRTWHAMCAFWCCLLHPPSFRWNLAQSTWIALFFCPAHVRLPAIKYSLVHMAFFCPVVAKKTAFPSRFSIVICFVTQWFDSGKGTALESVTFKNYDGRVP